MADDKIKFEISVEGNAENALKRITDAFKTMSDESEKGLKKSGIAMDVFVGTLASGGTIGALKALTGAATSLFDTFIVDGVKAASEQEDSLNRLNNALKTSGKFTVQASKDLDAFATAIQETTRFQDNAVLSAAALIESISQLDGKALQGATKAAIDLSVAIGKDLDSAALLIAKSSNGATAGIEKFTGEIKKGKTDAETFANVLAKVNERFGGRAEADVSTFSGSVTRLSNAFGELQEAFGENIVKNEAFISLVNALNEGLKFLTDGLRNNKDGFKTLINDGVLVAIDAMGELVGTARVLFGIFSPSSAKALLNLEVAFSALGDKVKETNRETFDASGYLMDIEGSGYGAAAAVKQLTEEQKKQAESSKQLVEQAAAQDPTIKFNAQAEALRLGVEQEVISNQQRLDALTVYNEQKNQAILDQHAKEIVALQSKNEYLISLDDEKFKYEIEANKAKIQTILANEAQGSVNRQVQRKKELADIDKYEKEKAAVITDTLNTVATLQNAKTKELQILGKAAGIAQATISTAVGISRAFEYLGPFGFPAAAAIAAAGAVQIAKISGVELETGITEVPAGFPNDTFQARLTSGERVVDSGTNQDLKSFLNNSEQMVPLLAGILDQISNLDSKITVNVGSKTIVQSLRDEQESGRNIYV